MAEAAIELERIETLKEACEGEDARENDGGTVSWGPGWRKPWRQDKEPGAMSGNEEEEEEEGAEEEERRVWCRREAMENLSFFVSLFVFSLLA